MRQFLVQVVTLASLAVPLAGQSAPAVVESKAPVWTKQTAWTVEAKPMVQIGLVDGAQPYLFDRVMGVTRMRDGRIVVATMGGNDIRFFDSAGKHVRTAGGQGEGPSEFTQVMGMTRGGGDSLFVRDGRLGTKVFTPAGEFSRLITEKREPPFVSLVGVFSDGTALGMTWPQGDRTRQGTWIENAEVYSISPDGSTRRRIGELPAVEFSAAPRYASHVQFGKSLSIAMGSDRFYHAFGDNFRITEYGKDGRPLRTFERVWTTVPVTKKDIDEFHETFVNAPDESGQRSAQFSAFRETRFKEMTFARSFPPIRMIRVDTNGNLWVRHYQTQKMSEAGTFGFGAVPLTPTRWSVFDGRSGRWLGEIDTPASFNVLEIGNDYIAGVARDELNVEFVRVYRLNKPR